MHRPAVVCEANHERGGSWKRWNGQAHGPSDRGDRTSDTPSSDALPRTTVFQTGYRGNIQPATCVSAVLDRPRGSLCCYRTKTDVGVCRTNPRNDLSSAASDPAERDHLSKSRRTMRLVPLALDPTSPPIPCINAQIESAIRPQNKRSFSTE